MTRLLQRTSLLGVGALALGVVASRGQTAAPDPPRWEVGVFGGWYSGATPYFLSGPVSGDVRLQAAATLGLRLGWDPSPRWGLELDWTHAQPEQSFVDTSLGAIRQLRLNIFELNTNLYIGRGVVRGFVTVGLGGANTGSSFGGANLSVDTGLGAKALLNRHINLRIDGRLRGTYGNLGPKDRYAYCDSLGCYSYRHKWYASYGFTGGLDYAF
jgi:hypothetical protein